MKAWLPTKGAMAVRVRFQPANGWADSMDRCSQMCDTLNDMQQRAAFDRHSALVAIAEQRRAEIRIIESLGIDCPLPELNTPAGVSFDLWRPTPVPHTPGWPDYPSDGILWLAASPVAPPEPEPESDMPSASLPDEPGEWRALSLIVARWAPSRAVAAGLNGFDRDVYSEVMAAARARHEVEQARLASRRQAFEAVQAAGLQPTFSSVPYAPKPFTEPTFEQWLSDQESGRSNPALIQIVKVSP